MPTARVPRLIEVAFPAHEVGVAARREKSLRHGHPATLHTWWSRKPLGAARAVVLASLWPDPAHPDCPAAFREEVAACLLPGQEPDPTALRQAASDFLAGFAPWERSSSRWHQETARRLVVAATRGGREAPLVVDPFAGGGSIPLEARRVGASVFASDLNPVAVLLCRTLLQEIPAAGPGLGRLIRQAGADLLTAAGQALGDLYPRDGADDQPLTYLWARTARCPDCGVCFPLLSKLVLEDTPRRRVGLLLRPEPPGLGIHVVPLEQAGPAPTVRRSEATCPCCGRRLGSAEVRRQLAARRGGAADAQLLAVVTATAGGRRYREATALDREGAARAAQALTHLKASDPGAVPDEQLPAAGTLGFSVRGFGLERWGDLFLPRQALALATLARLVRGAEEHLLQEGAAVAAAHAAATCLALAVDRQADYSSSLCRWHTTRALVNNTFGRQAISMVWDFAESHPLAAGSGSLAGAISWIAEVCEALEGSPGASTQVRAVSATALPLETGSAQAVVTDPPHYDAVPYADISEFFYVWLRRSARGLHPDLLDEPLVPRDRECVPSRSGGRGGAHFEQILAESLGEIRRVLDPQGVAVVIFAQRSQAGWVAAGRALSAAGLMVTASWPVATEMGGRLRARNSAVLTTTMHLVCRPREGQAAPATEVHAEIALRVQERLALASGGALGGLDAQAVAWAAALEAYTPHGAVPGLGLDEALEHASRVLATLVSGPLLSGGLDPAALLAVRWAEGADNGRLPRERALELAAECGAALPDLVAAGSWRVLEDGRLTPAPALEHALRLGSEPGSSSLDRLHQAMSALAQGGTAGMGGFLADISADDGLWALGQALLAQRSLAPDEQRLLAVVLGRRAEAGRGRGWVQRLAPPGG